jgi:hypothetical protein
MNNYEQAYDKLYAVAEALWKLYNPCEFTSKGECIRSIDDYRCRPNCCTGGDFQSDPHKVGHCEHLAPTGCTVKSLACKLWMCNTVRVKHPDLYKALVLLESKARELGVPTHACRKSKEQTFKMWEG